MDCTLSCRRDLISLQDRATNAKIPQSTIQSLPLPVQRAIEPFLMGRRRCQSDTSSSPEPELSSVVVEDWVTMTPPPFLEGPEVDVIKAILNLLAA